MFYQTLHNLHIRKIYGLILLFLPASFFAQKQPSKDSLVAVLNSNAHDTTKVRARISLAIHFRNMHLLDSAARHIEIALEAGKKIKFPKGTMSAFIIAGTIEEARSDYMKGLDYCNEAMKLATELKDEKGMIAACSNAGLIHQALGNYPESLKNHLIALKGREKLNDLAGIAISCNNLGNAHDEMRNTDLALKYYRRAVQVRIKTGDKKRLAQTYSNIGLVYLHMNRYDLALNEFYAAKSIFDSLNDVRGRAFVYDNIGAALRRKSELVPEKNAAVLQTALEMGRAALELFVMLGDREGEASAAINIGSVMLDLNNYTEAETYFSRSLSIAKQIRSKVRLKDSYLAMSQVKETTGAYKQSLEYFRLHILYADSLVNEENTRRNTQQQMQYEFDKKSAADSIRHAAEKRIADLSHEKQITDQKRYTVIGISAFVMMLVVAGISFVAFRSKKRANAEITRQKTMVEEKQKEIMDSIRYAGRIQKALIPSEKQIEKSLRKLTLKT